MQKAKGIAKVFATGILIAIALTLLTGFTRDEIRYVTTTYTVQANERLKTIASKFIVKNTGTVRRPDEFEEGIRQLNYDLIGDGDVKEGQILKIGWWEKR